MAEPDTPGAELPEIDHDDAITDVCEAVARLLERWPDSRPDALALATVLDGGLPGHLFAALDCLYGLSKVVDMGPEHWRAMARHAEAVMDADDQADDQADAADAGEPAEVERVAPIAVPAELQAMVDGMLAPYAGEGPRRARNR